jgi:hypothetical protein
MRNKGIMADNSAGRRARFKAPNSRASPEGILEGWMDVREDRNSSSLKASV